MQLQFSESALQSVMLPGPTGERDREALAASG